MKLAYPYMLVDLSPWPILVSFSLLSLMIGAVMLFNLKIGGGLLLILSLVSLLIGLYFWFSDIIAEGTYKGLHTKKVQQNLTIGFLLFVVSEAALFFALFFGYFYNSLVPNVFVGAVWPPVGIEPLDYEAIPLLNTAILFFSGITVTGAQHAMNSPQVGGKEARYLSISLLLLTIILGLIFTYLQYIEYINAPFTMSDSIYGTGFYMLTGFHGGHVILGTLLLIVSLIRLIGYQVSSHGAVGSTSAALYWHFVDAIWILLYILIYVYGS